MVQKQIAIYGKGGIGKSTVSSNLAAAMAHLGKRVMLVGCDPKQDTTMSLCGGTQLPSVLDHLLLHGEENTTLDDICFQGPHGIILVESGGPEPGVGCAGRGVITALEVLENLNAVEHFGIDIVIYDVLGDVVCGGFAMPLRTGYANEIYLVSSGELMALYAANNICKAVKRLASPTNNIGVSGIILNRRNVKNEEELTRNLANNVGILLAADLPRDGAVQRCDGRKETVVAREPDSLWGQKIIGLAGFMIENNTKIIPVPMLRDDLTEMVRTYNEDTQHSAPVPAFVGDE